MSILKIQLQDNKKSVLTITNKKSCLYNYIHIKRMFLFKDILILNNTEYKYNSRSKLLEDIEMLRLTEEVLNRETVLKFIDSYRITERVQVRDIVLMDELKHMFPLERVYNSRLKKEYTIVKSRFSLYNLSLYNNDKTYRKKLHTLRSIIKQEFIWIYDKEDVDDFKILVNDILKYKYK